MSITIAGLVLLVLSYLAKAVGFELKINEADITHVITTGTEIVGLVVAYYGRIRQGDVNYLGIKK